MIILTFIFTILIVKESNSQTLVKLRTEITPETVKEYDEYIREFAPSDSAFRVLTHWANRHYHAKRASVSIYLLEVYKNLFPGLIKAINSDILRLEQIMISQTPEFSTLHLYHDFVKKNAPSDDAFFGLQRIADYYIKDKKWDSCITLFNHYSPVFPEKNEIINDIIEILSAPEQGLIIENLGPNINTRGSEWDPSPTPDGRYLYFSADYRKRGYGGADIWVSQKIEGIWQQAENLSKPINGNRDETIDNVTVDGTTLILSGNFHGSYGAYDIYLAEKDSADWMDLVHLPSPVNSEFHDESGAFSPDGNAIFFTSDRPDGIGPYIPMGQVYYGGTNMGNMDIYVSIASDDGWSEPVNLGSTINTPYAERAVYMHPDGKTLYFSSNGHGGLGRLDVFKTVRLSDTSWTEWSKPINLGKEINSINDDWGYVVDLEGKVAYFAKENADSGYGGWDIYSITLPDVAKPQPFAIITGNVTDVNGKALASNIVWEDLSTGEKVGHLKSDPRDGSYFIVLPLGKKYGYYAERRGFYPISKNIDLTDSTDKITVEEDITLVSVTDMQDKGFSIRVNNVFFDFDEDIIKSESIPELERLYSFLKKLHSYSIIISGHTDDTGNEKHNRDLSKRRAQSVANFLIDKGIEKDRINIKGFGSEKPKAPNDSEYNRALNRRVEIKLER